MNVSHAPVSVGKSSLPLKSSATLRGPVPLLTLPNASGLPWRLLDGPPYANGAPHVGHVFNKHLKDAMVRAQAAQGKSVEWRPGWDCHGLPLELAVEKTGVPRREPAVFVPQARAYAQSQVELQAEEFRGQGWSADWSTPWRTMDPCMEAGTLRVLADLLDAGRLDVRHTAVPWCAACRSTLSMAEQEDHSVTQETWLVPFALGERESVLVWTTTPWTLPLNQGLVVHPKTVYVALSLPEGRKAWVSEATAETWAQALGCSVGDRCLGATLAGRAYTTAWAQGQVVADDRVLPEAGTGVLHAVAGLADLDTRLALDHGWEVRDCLSPDGRVQASPCESQNGLLAEKATTPAVEAAFEGLPGFLRLPRKMVLPHCWRHKTPTLTRSSRQVFLRLNEQVRQQVNEWVETGLQFTPLSAKARLRSSVATRPDWCLSRQRTWGVPLALFVDRQTGQPHPKASLWMRRAADAFEAEGVEAWWASDSSRWVQNEVPLEGLDRLDDVLDVWFDSGCVPQLVGPADAVVEGTDQHRGWFQSCLWVAAALGQTEPPFRHVVTHGFVVNTAGEKVSKSTGGDAKQASRVPSWRELPTDVVRAWALAGGEGSEKAWTADTVGAATAAVARWRGVLRFLLANRLEVPVLKPKAPLEAWDRWWWQRCNETAQAVVDACALGQTGTAVTLAQTFGDEFSAVALGAWKDRLYCAPSSTLERQRLDVVVRGCLGAWAWMLSVLAPRLVSEALEHGLNQGFGLQQAPGLSPQEAQEVKDVLDARAALSQASEALSLAKVPPGRRHVAWGLAPSWPENLLADALDVAEVSLSDGLEVLESPHPVCPRCRRAQRHWEGPQCRPCHTRVALEEGVVE